MISSFASSQRPLGDSCVVPCHTLVAALNINNRFLDGQKQVEFARDSITHLGELLRTKDTLIQIKDSSITVYKHVILQKDQIVQAKDNIINVYKRHVFIGYTLTFIATILLIL